MARVTAPMEELVKQCISRGSWYSTHGRTCKAMHYTLLVLQHSGNDMKSNALHVARVTADREEHVKQCVRRGSWYGRQGRTYKVMHYKWPVLQHPGKNM